MKGRRIIALRFLFLKAIKQKTDRWVPEQADGGWIQAAQMELDTCD